MNDFLEQTDRAVVAALTMYISEHGKLRDGDSFVVALNNCTLTVSLHGGRLNTEFSNRGTKVKEVMYRLNGSLDIYGENLFSLARRLCFWREKI